MPTPHHLPHSQKRTLQTAFLPQISAYPVNLNAGYRKLFKKLIPFSFSFSIYNNRECSFVILEEKKQVKIVTYYNYFVNRPDFSILCSKYGRLIILEVFSL